MKIFRFDSKNRFTSFIKNFIVIISGSTIAQILNLAFQPILTRLYNTEEFGLYALFISGASLLSVIATFRFDLSIVTAEDDSDAKDIFYLCISISCLFAVLIGLLIISFKTTISDVFNLKEHNDWLYLLPVAIMLNGLYSTANSFNYRLKKYKDISKATLFRVSTLLGFQILFFYLGFSYWGLIIGYSMSLLCGSYKLIDNTFKHIKPNREFASHLLFNVFKKYKDFPLYQLPISFVNHFTYESITYSMASMYPKSSVGLYSLSNNVLSLPLSVVSETVRQLFIKQVSEDRSNLNHIRNLFIYIGTFLFIGIAVPFLILAFYGTQIFGGVFGIEWAEAGSYVQSMFTLYIVRFVVYPLSGVVLVFKRQKIILIYQCMLIICVFLVTAFVKFFGLQVTSYLLVLSTMMSIIYIAMGITCYRMCIDSCVRQQK